MAKIIKFPNQKLQTKLFRQIKADVKNNSVTFKVLKGIDLFGLRWTDPPGK